MSNPTANTVTLAEAALNDLARSFRMRGQPPSVEIRMEQLFAIDAERTTLRSRVEAICQHRGTPPAVRARLRHALAGIDWRKVK